MPKIEIETKYYKYYQNNSGGHYELNDKDGIGHYLIIEARNYEEANNRFNEIVENYSSYCSCCGDRWWDFDDDNDSDIYQDLEKAFNSIGSDSRKEDLIVFVHDYDEKITKKVIKYENNNIKN